MSKNRPSPAPSKAVRRQMRLDKIARRYAKRVKSGVPTVRYL